MEASEFAMCMALFNHQLSGELSSLLARPSFARLYEEIQSKCLHHDWYHSTDLDEFLSSDLDYCAFQELVCSCIRIISDAGWTEGVSVGFYRSLSGAKFGPPFPDKTHWRAVAWPMIQILSVPLLRGRLTESGTYLRTMGW
jgi:hypothetical protein